MNKAKYFSITYDMSKLSDDEQKAVIAEASSFFRSQKAVCAGWESSDNGWISVDDELPPNGGDFWLVYTDKGRIAECRYFSDEWITTYCNNERVTHWQPLPKRPKE